MSMNVYNIVWADDEIDDFLDEDYENDLRDMGFVIIGKARDGLELEKILEKTEMIDAVIVDANFNESSSVIESERDISGLTYARSIYIHKFNRAIPFFLYTNRTEELLRDITKNNPSYLNDFPRHRRWFSKYLLEERNEMFDAIKKEVDERKTTSFIIRNRYRKELAYADVLGLNAYDYIFVVLCRDWDNTLADIREPFATARKIVEQIFGQCEKVKLIPPISDNTNGTGDYFLYKSFSPIDVKTKKRIPLYRMKDDSIMAKPLAQSLVYFLDMTQDGAHRKSKLPLKVDEYFINTKDVFLLRSVLFILIDLIKWFIETWKTHMDPDVNEIVLWEKV